MPQGKVLVIDDEQIVLVSVQRILEAEGFTVDLSASGKQGRAWALERAYDLVLSDIRMPEVGGMRVLRDIKRAKPHLPIVIITGYATVASAVQAMKLGAADYVEKPFTPDGLLQAVRGAITSAQVRQPENQMLVHPAEVLLVLERAAREPGFTADLFYNGADALDPYNLTGAEKLAILTGDINWIEEHIGPLSKEQRRWLEQRLSAEIW
ncbi:MAG TPA: response regulator [Spirochaetia bacterium]|nr:response regulator [Spirochaetia bacterium]